MPEVIFGEKTWEHRLGQLLPKKNLGLCSQFVWAWWSHWCFFNQFSLWSCSCNDKSQWQLREKRGGPKGGYGEECGLESHIMEGVFNHPRLHECLRVILLKPGRLVRTRCMNPFSYIYLKWDVAGCLLLLVNVILTGYVLATVLLCCSNQVPAGCAAAVDTTEQVQWLRFWQPFFRHLGHYNHVVNGASNSNVASRA